MGGTDVDLPHGDGVDPPAEDAPAGKRERMRNVTLDDGKFEVAAVRGR
jgi:hypothetical protein